MPPMTSLWHLTTCLDTYWDTYLIVTSVSRYKSYREASVSLHPYELILSSQVYLHQLVDIVQPGEEGDQRTFAGKVVTVLGRTQDVKPEKVKCTCNTLLSLLNKSTPINKCLIFPYYPFRSRTFNDLLEKNPKNKHPLSMSECPAPLIGIIRYLQNVMPAITE